MEPNCCAAVPAADGRLTFYASNQMPHAFRGQLAAALGIDAHRCACHRPAGRRGVRRQAGDLRRVLGGGRRGPAPRPAGHVDAGARRRPRLAPPLAWSDPVRRARVPARRDVHRPAGAPRRRRRRLPGRRRLPPGRHQAHVERHLPLPRHPVRRRRRRHQHHPDGRLPRGRPPGGDGAARATRRPRRARARHRPDRAAPPQPHRRRRLPVRHAHRPHLRQRALRHAARRRRRGGRVRRAAPPAGGAPGATATRVALGIGVAAYVEITAGGSDTEFGAVEVHDDGSATVRAGTSAHGQGHQTSFAMLVNDQTGIPIDRIRLVDGDTDLVPSGGGTGGSRSLQLGGSAVHRATEAARRAGQATRRPPPRGRRRRHRRRRRRRHGRRRRCPGGRADVGRARPTRRRRAAGRARRRRRSPASSPPSRTSSRGARPSRSGLTSPSSRSTSTPVVSASSATSPSTTAARSSIRCSCRVSSTAGSPPGSARRSTKRSATTRRATR